MDSDTRSGTPCEAALPASVTEAEKEQEVLGVINAMDEQTARRGVDLIFDVLRAWEVDYGKVSDELLEAACCKLSIDPRVGMIYVRCAGLILPMEALRRGVPVQRVKVAYAMSEESRRWWHALLIVRVLLKCGGKIEQVRLMRWLAHRMTSQELRAALALLREHRLVETSPVKSTDPLRPRTYHRLSAALQAAARPSSTL